MRSRKGLFFLKLVAGSLLGILSYAFIAQPLLKTLYQVYYKGLPAVYNMERNNISGKKLILYFNRPSEWHHTFDKCEFNQCEFSDDKKDYFISDAILFHAPRINLELSDLPPKPKGQIWVYMSQESAVYTVYKTWRNMFNWTWTNRRDSDIYDPYGQVEVNRKPLKKDFSEIFKKKNRTAFWYVSNCNTEGKREDFVKILKNYIDIDVYGKCSNSLRKPEKRDKHLIGEIYKFYLAFENSLCNDYITEKVLHMLPDSIVPIVRGEPTLELFLPPGSYIDTKHFSSISQLGIYVRRLQLNESEYISYFKWKNYYRAFQIQTRGICSFCKLLHTDHRGLYTDIDGWVNSPAGKPLCNTDPQDIYE